MGINQLLYIHKYTHRYIDRQTDRQDQLLDEPFRPVINFYHLLQFHCTTNPCQSLAHFFCHYSCVSNTILQLKTSFYLNVCLPGEMSRLPAHLPVDTVIAADLVLLAMVSPVSPTTGSTLAGHNGWIGTVTMSRGMRVISPTDGTQVTRHLWCIIVCTPSQEHPVQPSPTSLSHGGCEVRTVWSNWPHHSWLRLSPIKHTQKQVQWAMHQGDKRHQ